MLARASAERVLRHRQYPPGSSYRMWTLEKEILRFPTIVSTSEPIQLLLPLAPYSVSCAAPTAQQGSMPQVEGRHTSKSGQELLPCTP